MDLGRLVRDSEGNLAFWWCWIVLIAAFALSWGATYFVSEYLRYHVLNRWIAHPSDVAFAAFLLSATIVQFITGLLITAYFTEGLNMEFHPFHDTLENVGGFFLCHIIFWWFAWPVTLLMMMLIATVTFLMALFSRR